MKKGFSKYLPLVLALIMVLDFNGAALMGADNVIHAGYVEELENPEAAPQEMAGEVPAEDEAQTPAADEKVAENVTEPAAQEGSADGAVEESKGEAAASETQQEDEASEPAPAEVQAESGTTDTKSEIPEDEAVENVTAVEEAQEDTTAKDEPAEVEEKAAEEAASSEASEESAEEEAPVEIDYSKLSIQVRSTLPDVVKLGDRVTLTAVLAGFEGLTYQLQWQCNATGLPQDWVDVEGATGDVHTYIATEKTVGYAWRVVASIDE